MQYITDLIKKILDLVLNNSKRIEKIEEEIAKKDSLARPTKEILKERLEVSEQIFKDTPAQNQYIFDLIAYFEGVRYRAYKDIAGVWTIGIGNTRMPSGRPVREGDTLTKTEVLLLAMDEIKKHRKFAELVKVPLKTRQFAALNSFEYNLGSGR